MTARRPVVEPAPHDSARGRIVGIDLGERRIGIAVSDSARRLAFAQGVITRSGDEVRDRAALLDAISALDATVVVVGLPTSLSGDRGPAAQRAEKEIAWLSAALSVPVEAFDERLSTVEATKRRRLSKTDGRSRSRRVDRGPVDHLAAEVFLQAFLDRLSVTR